MEPNISIFASIFIGVISGVATSILVWVVVRLFKNTILPWYQSVIYRGQEISGDWDGYALFPKNDGKEVGEEKCSIIHLEQKGNNVSGDIILIKQPTGEKTSKKYNLKGFFHDNSLVLTYEVADKTRFGLGACVFRLVDDGQKLDGYWTAISSNAPKVFSSTEYWERKK
jgi:hypothetical protein